MLFDPRIFRLARPVWRKMAATFLVGLGISLTYIGQGRLMAGVLSGLLAERSLSGLLLPLAAVLTLMATRGFLQWLHEVCAMRTVGAVKSSLRTRLYRHLLELGPGYLSRIRTGKVQSTLVDGVEALEGYLGYYLPQMIIALVVPAGVLLYLARIDAYAAELLLLFVFAVATLPRLYRRALGTRARAHWQALSGLNAQFVDAMQGMATLKAFGASEAHGESLSKDAMSLYRAVMGQMAVSMLGTGINYLAQTAGAAVVVVTSALRLSAGLISTHELFLILFFSTECMRPLTLLNTYWHQGLGGQAAAEGIFALLDSEPEVCESASKGDWQASRHPTLAFEDVTFAYAGRDAPAVRNLSFAAEPGEVVALVGPSGAGKSTIVSLLLRFFDPGKGRITLDGVDIKQYGLADLRSRFAVVAQDTYLFHGTVEDNLRLAKPDATEEEIRDAARAANADRFIYSLPQGYSTKIGERGLKLSGGQRQRLAIARALLKDAPILVLDEATSSVDAASERAIQEALERLMAGRTTLIIAHRLTTVKNADRILVLDGGEIIDEGDHRSLLGHAGLYRRLVGAQSEGVAQ